MPLLRRPARPTPLKSTFLQGRLRPAAATRAFIRFSFYPVFITLLFSLTPFSALHAQEFAAALIPEGLKTGADAVIRASNYDIDLKSPSQAILRRRRVITILNEHGEDLAWYRTDYDKFLSIRTVEGVLLNASGKEIRRFKKKDMSDHPEWDGMSLALDGRYKSAGFSCHDYPYTVIFEEEDEVNGLIGLGDWVPQIAMNCAVQTAHCSITVPKEYSVRYKMVHSQVEPVVTETKDKRVYNWELKDISPVPAEAFSSPWTATQPFMLIAPSVFEVAGYKGDMSTWNEYAKFLGDLIRGRDALPEDVKAKVHTLTDKEPDPHKKIAILYDFMQRNTHYISVQLGIGGWQPFDASYVSHNKYGDCKALSNFMMALLKEAGIPANIVYIHAGKNATDFNTDFPDNQFNHAICCVPMARDTVWLECTDQYLSPGYLGSHTANRYGLLIADHGGALVHTPDYAAPENTQRRKILATVDSEGNLRLQCNGLYRGEEQDELESLIHHQSHAEQETWLKKEFDLPTYDVNSFDYQLENGASVPLMKETLGITANSYAQVSGRRLFIDPNLLTRSEIRFQAGETRHRFLDYRDSYLLEDSVEISIPRGYIAESTPKAQQLETPFGVYRTSFKITAEKIFYHRYFEQRRGTFPATDFPKAAGFYNTVYRSDRDRIVLTKNE